MIVEPKEGEVGTSKTVIAVIPVRGGSVGIPRKNARLIGGKPLLAYSIENALVAKEIHKVFVSTDDAELAEIARRFGADVLHRPKELADGLTTLDSVICQVASELQEGGQSFSHIVTLQATSPLLTPLSIDRAVRKCLFEELDTVLTVVDDRHLTWTLNEDVQPVPCYQKRVNRQYLPQIFRETGGVVVATREILASGSRFGEKTGIVEVEHAEAIDIDDYFDWWLVEKSLSRRRICFHVIGNTSSGLGHVYRALTLADRLIDHEISFLVNTKATLAVELIRQRFYTLHLVEPGREADKLIEEEFDLVVNDVLDTNIEFMDQLQKAKIATVNFEDLGSGSKKADYLINAMYVEPPGHSCRNVYHGIEYDCLRDEFYSIAPREMQDEVKNILLLFGGTDPNDLTLQVMQWLEGIPGQWKVTLVLGVGYGEDRCQKLKRLARQMDRPVEVITDTPIISRFMAEADLAITSAGRTVFELASLAVPMITIAQNERETQHDFVKKSPGVAYLGLAQDVSYENFAAALLPLLKERTLREQMREKLLATGIRDGVEHIVEILLQALVKRKR